MNGFPGARMLALGTALPDQVVTNADLARTVDTSDDWITERTGIKERRVGSTTADLAARAAREAIERSAVDPSTIDMLILATTTPDRRVPATASTVQQLIGAPCGACGISVQATLSSRAPA